MIPDAKTVIEIIDEMVAKLWDRDETPMGDEEFYEKYQKDPDADRKGTLDDALERALTADECSCDPSPAVYDDFNTKQCDYCAKRKDK